MKSTLKYFLVITSVISIICSMSIPVKAQNFDEPWSTVLQAGYYSFYFNGVKFAWDIISDNTYGGTQDGLFTVSVSVTGRGFNEYGTFTLEYLALYGGVNYYSYDAPEYYEWINGIIEEVTMLPEIDQGGQAPVPSDPVIGQALRTFRTMIFSDRVESRIEKREQESKVSKMDQMMLKPNNTNSDIEYDFFKIGEVKGKNLTIRAGFARTIDEMGEITVGANFYMNSLDMEDWDSALKNNYIGIFGKKIISESDISTTTVGLNLDILMFDNDYSDKTGTGLGAMIANKRYIGENLLNWGGMFNYTTVDVMKAQYLSAGAMYGFPIGEKTTLTIDALSTYTLGMSVSGESIDIDDPVSLILGGYLGIYVSQAFQINGGMKKTLLVKDYSSLEIVIGAGYRW